MFVLLLFPHLHTGVREFASGLKVLRIKSISQTVTDHEQVLFSGNVEAWIDRRLHIWADRIFVDKKKQIIMATSNQGGAVIVEDDNFFILADRCVFNILQKTGYADNLRLHVDEGYFSARKAEKISDTNWRLDDMVYTACDASKPHWRICASRAMVHATYFVKASGIVFEAGSVPVLGLPSFVFPIQGHSKSGFLIPRFAFDYDYGLGIKQEYYKYFTPHFDTTFGVDWRDRKGVVFSDEVRIGRAPENYTHVNVQYAILRDRFLEKNQKIVKATEHRYWVNGKDFRAFPRLIGSSDLFTLLRLDCGNDKQIGYHFFNNTSDVDDTYYNSMIARLWWPTSQVDTLNEFIKTSRKHFFNVNNPYPDLSAENIAVAKGNSKNLSVVKEVDDHVDVTYLPHAEWNMSFKEFGKFFYYRQDLFFDQVLYRQKEIERWYANSVLVREDDPLPLSKADLIRFLYRGVMTEAFSVASNTLSFNFIPTFQIVSQLKDSSVRASSNVLERPLFANGAYRLFFEYGAEWALPEGTVRTADNQFRYSIQPVITWEFLPKFYQDNWYFVDKWDRAYPKNELACLVRNTWDVDSFSIDFDIKQGYDFYSRTDIFPLRRGVTQKHILPFRYDLQFSHENFMIGCGQEYEWGDGALLQSEITTSLMVKRVNIALGYLYQKQSLQTSRELLSNIPHFVTVNVAIPLGKHMQLSYDGQFYATQRSSFFFFDGITPLIHRIRFDYDGHCWGFYVGYEQKKYKECGIGRDERAIVFAFRLDSLGSFAKKFRKAPQLLPTQKKEVFEEG